MGQQKQRAAGDEEMSDSRAPSSRVLPGDSAPSGSGVQQGKAAASVPQTGRAAGGGRPTRSAVSLPLFASPASAEEEPPGQRGQESQQAERSVPALLLPWLLCRRNPRPRRRHHSTKKRISTTSRTAKRTAMAHHWRRSERQGRKISPLRALRPPGAGAWNLRQQGP